MGLESSIEAALREYAKKKNVAFYKFVSPGAPGVPDRLLVGPTGKCGFLEIKAPGKRPEPHQARVMETLEKRGCTVGWTDSIAYGKQFIDSLV